jgi:CRP-like cAMP-binding protein
VFPRADDDSIDRLIESHTRREAQQGDRLDLRHDGREVLLIVEGQVAVAQDAPDGRASYLGVVGSGSLVGLATLDGGAQLIELDALGTPVVMVAWPGEAVRTIAEGDRGLLLDLVDQLAYRFRSCMLLLERQTFAPSRARLASFLLRHESLVASPESRLVRRQMAALAGVSQEMVGRILRRWERDGIVKRVGTSGLAVMDRRRLQDEAAPADSLGPRPTPRPAA